ncbi:MAG: FkbM family methyltransferase [Bacteroidota bacterium]
MKTIIKKLLKSMGFKLVKTKYLQAKLPKADIENVEIIVRFHQLLNQKMKVLQVGACDGQTSDSIFTYIQSGDIEAYLVEPSTTNFQLLEDFYKNKNDNVTLIHAAVAEKDEIKDFYSVKDEGRWKNQGWARQLASFYKEHLINHGILEDEITVEQVQCKRLSTLTADYNIKDFDLLLVDTEGYDGEIIKMALNENITPTFIAFEYGQIVKFYTQEQINDLYKLLSQKDYVFCHDARNTLAIKKSFFAA